MAFREISVVTNMLGNQDDWLVVQKTSQGLVLAKPLHGLQFVNNFKLQRALGIPSQTVENQEH